MTFFFAHPLPPPLLLCHSLMASSSSSITCTTIPRPNNSPISIYTNHHLPPHNSVVDFSPPRRKLFPRQSRRRQHRLLSTPRLFVSNTYNPDPYSFQQQKRDRRTPTLFPGGYKRPEIKVPTLVLRVNADEVLGSEKCRDRIDVAVAKGVVGIVVLGNDGGGGGRGGGRVYEAAGVLKGVIRDRAYVVIEDRVDVASAVGANGVLLSDQGLPAIVARNMLSKSSSESVLLPLVARTVQTMENALNASSSEGADFLIVSIDSENYAKVVDEFATIDVKIPIFFAVGDKNRADSLDSMAMNLLQFGASGMVISLDDLNLLCESVIDKWDALTVNGRIQGNIPSVKPMHTGNGGKEGDQRKMVAGFTKLEDREIKFIEAEKDVLLDAITIMRRAAPLMEEVSLLVDAIARLDQPFLVVIVGEFNSGKSTVINALLGSRYLKEGVVPTTNEITLLCYSDTNSVDQERCERHPDGQFICYLNAPILKEMNLVDTPGTNVILQRQQRLTEEYVPRADLVLFVLSSDRPLTESEVSFLLYIRQWKKRIVFILNKADLYRNSSELEEAMEFVKANIRTMLNAELVELYPVSARSVVEAKVSGRASGEALLDNLSWASSGFYELENFLFSFLDGSTATGMERMRLKLETPIAIADRLFAACERHTNQEFELACKDLAAVNELVDSVNNYAIKMESESILWKKQTSLLVETAKTRAVKLLQSILQLSNIDLLASYAFRGGNSSSTSATASVRSDIISPALSDIQKLLVEYLQWLDSNNAMEVQQYLKSFETRLPGLISPNTTTHPETFVLMDNQGKVSAEIVRNFSASAASRLLDQEIREVVLGTYGGLGVAGLSASLLTSVLPTTLEDLLALALCSAGGLFAISNFPSRRKNAIEKVTKVADALAKEISEAMLEDLSKAIENLRIFVKQTGKPYQEAAQKEIDRLSEIKSELDRVQRRIQALKTDIQNLNVL